ncbi:MAG: methyltransferase domain-containing protein [Planctomycetes bacterium]|nr:methyltransferase domain-containing protein [Planctomycetota bacterium]MCB9888113.1 methyltransferase domain-containing protein [Planctomycetota bacterium]
MTHTDRTCPACGRAPLRVFAELPGVPVHCNVLYDDATAARSASRGDITLGFCDACSLVHNVTFDPARLSYDQEYENSLHFSPRFRDYADRLAGRLLRDHGGADLDILEIGCGKGDFLVLLTAGGANRCVGFDASFEERVNPTADVPGLSIRSEFFDAETHRERADLLVSRHVLEHIAEPTEFVRRMAQGLKDGPAATLFFEVPNGLWTLRDLGIWDLIYEHCSYFTAAALLEVFRSAGYWPRAFATEFGEQFLWVEATRSPAPAPQPDLPVAEVAALADAFGEQLRAKVDTWNQRLGALREEGARVVLWGAGSKGVTFLNVVENGASVAGVIDINPRKTDRFVPGTGQCIHQPEWLGQHDADVVLVMNPIYEHEIGERLRELGSRARTVTV